MVDTEDIHSLSPQSSTPRIEKKKIVLQSADGYNFEVEEAVASQMYLVKYNTTSTDSNEPFYRLPGITKETLVKVIDYCRHHVLFYIRTTTENWDPALVKRVGCLVQLYSHLYTQAYISTFDAKFIKQVDPVVLFNLIQAAHHFKIKSLMDLTCQALVNLVKTKTFGEIMKEFKIDQKYVQSFAGKHVESLPNGLQIAIEHFGKSMKLDRVLRQRRKEMFIKRSDFVDTEFSSSFVFPRLSFIDRRTEVARYISEELLQRKLEGDRHIVLACYALQYLTYRPNAAIGKTSLDTLIDFICEFYDSNNPLVAGQHLVVGNLARLANTDEQIQCLVLDSKLLGCLRRVMAYCKFKSFRKEACQIVSNIAARSNTLIKDMDDEVHLKESLCGLLEKDESDVRMEAAWAMFNCIYGNKFRQVDNYSKTGLRRLERHHVPKIGIFSTPKN